MDEARATAAVDLVRRPHAEVALAFGGDRVGALAVSLLAHALERFAIEAGCTVHVESAGSDDHHVAEAAYKALGQALRQAVAPGDAGHPLDEGRGVKVAIADYGAGNLRSLSSALARAGVEPVVTTDAATRARRAARADRGRRARRERSRRARAQRPRRRAARARRGRAAGRGDLRRACSSSSSASEEGGEGLGLLAGPVRRLRARRVPHMGWNTLAATRASALLDGLDGADVYFAHSFAADAVRRRASRPRPSTTTARSSRPSSPARVAGVQFHPERSAAAGARVLENLVRWSRSA